LHVLVEEAGIEAVSGSYGVDGYYSLRGAEEALASSLG
jgi:hypothetical protein